MLHYKLQNRFPDVAFNRDFNNIFAFLISQVDHQKYLFSATNLSSYIIELIQLYDTIQIEWNYAWIHYNIAIRSHLMI